jgi:ABC-type multidrug transport system fused ATPase/permease subunit
MLEVDDNISICRLFSYLCHRRWIFFICITFCVLDGLTMPAIGVFLAQMLASLLRYLAGVDQTTEHVYRVIYAAVGVSFGGALCSAIAWWTGTILGEDIVKKIKLDLFGKLLRLPLTWFERE